MRYRVVVDLNNASAALNMDRDTLAPLHDRFPALCFDYLSSPRRLADSLQDAQAVLCWRFSAEWYRLAPHLRIVVTPAAGRDWVAPAPDARVRVHHCSFHGALIAESMLAAMLHINDRRDLMRAAQAAHRWAADEQMPRRLLGSQQVLLVGYGAIARHCARLLRAMGCTVTGTKREPRQPVDPLTAARLEPYGALPRLLPEADHVVLLLPGGAATRSLFGARELAAMKPSAVLYNYGRGTVLDEEALAAALRAGRPAAAVLDVFEQEPLAADSPLWDLPQVMITPHSSCHYLEYAELFRREAAQVLASAFGASPT